MNKIVLIYPKTGFDFEVIGLPYSLLTIAAELIDKFQVILIDQRIDNQWKNRLKSMLSDDCLCVSISSMTGTQLKYALEIAQLVRITNPKIPIIWGGVHVTILSEQSLKNQFVDIVVRDEGEATFLELAFALQSNKKLSRIKGISFKKDNKIIHNPPRPFIDINKLKPIPWELIKVEKYFMKGQVTKHTKREFDLGETSRGCPYRCKFCYNSIYNFVWRPMTPENTVKILKEAIDRFNIDAFWLRDDNFFVDVKRVDKILDLMKKEKIDIPWYSSGVRIETINKLSSKMFKKLIGSQMKKLRIGAESGNDRILKLINKNISSKDIISANLRLKKYKIPVEYSYIIGFPTEKLKEMYDTVNLALQLKKDNPFSISHNINIYTPYPGTKLYETCLKMGFKEPKSIEEWSKFHHLNINFNLYNKKEQGIMKNINETSYYSSGITYDNLPIYLKVISFPLRKWCDFRFKNKMFNLRSDLEIVKNLRKIALKI